jgi:hypothetical protein
MFRSRVTRCAVGLAAAVVLAGGTARGAEPAADNASQGDYSDGWQAGDNGGFGFLPWMMTSTGGTGGVGSSTANGDARAPAGDIDSAGGRAWWVSTKSPNGSGGGSIEATRRLIGALGVGQRVSFDLDGYPNTVNADAFTVILGNANGPRWSVGMDAFFTRFDDGVTPGGVKLAPLTFEGIHVDVTLTGPDSLEIAARVLGEAEPVVVHAALSGASGSPIDRITFGDYLSLGSVDAFYVNNLAVTPEPGVAGALLFGSGLLVMRRRR